MLYLLTCSVTLKLHNFAPTSSLVSWNSETRTIIEMFLLEHIRLRMIVEAQTNQPKEYQEVPGA